MSHQSIGYYANVSEQEKDTTATKYTNQNQSRIEQINSKISGYHSEHVLNNL